MKMISWLLGGLCLIYGVIGEKLIGTSCEYGACTYFDDCVKDNNLSAYDRDKLDKYEKNMGCVHENQSNIKSVCCLQNMTKESFNLFSHKNFPLMMREDGNSCGVFTHNNETNGNKRPVYGNASIYETNWKAVIFESSTNASSANCTGTIINDRYIMTTDNCVKEYKNIPQNLTVRLGDLILSSETDCVMAGDRKICLPAMDYSVAKIHIEEIAEKTFKIALLRLNRTIQFDNRITHACLPFDFKDEPKTSFSFHEYGWGISQTRLPVNFDWLQYTRDAVAYVEKRPGILWAKAISTNEKCITDFGSALTWVKVTSGRQKYEVFGIARMGPLGCEHYPDNMIPHTKVSPSLEWILNTIEP